MNVRKILLIAVCVALISSTVTAKIKALIIDGQNNHAVWPKSTIMMKQYLEDTDLFEVDIARSKFTWRAQREKEFLPLAGAGKTEDLKKPKSDPDFSPDFKKYDVVISNFGYKAADWPKATREAFEKYVAGGGGFVVVHAADNSFPKWKKYNKMIGVGRWGGRTAKDGPYVYYTNEGKLVRDPSKGRCGSHGPAHNIPITVRISDHPITKGLPKNWLTAKDECYALLRGPAENMTILATGKDMSGRAPTDRHEPMLMVIDYGKGRVFHTALGHDDYSFEGVGFIVTFLRGTEWAATGKVTQGVPKDFPTAEKPSSRNFKYKKPVPPPGQILPEDDYKASKLFISEWLKGNPVDVTDGKKIYIVEFWATWCPPCRTSIPHLSELQKKYKDSVTIIGVTGKAKEAQRGVTLEQVRKFVADENSDIEYTVALDKDGKSSKAYQGRYNFKWIPHAYVISKKGNVIWYGHPMSLDGVLEKIVDAK